MDVKVERIFESERVGDLADPRVRAELLARLGHDHAPDGTCLIGDAERLIEVSRALMRDDAWRERIVQEFASLMKMMLVGAAAAVKGEPSDAPVKGWIAALTIKALAAGYLQGHAEAVRTALTPEASR